MLAQRKANPNFGTIYIVYVFVTTALRANKEIITIVAIFFYVQHREISLENPCKTTNLNADWRF
ncbi:MAG: hypothetical protein EVJ47_07065 [Candidatus Acidulodesulfobacterium ferriphilum]|uniref:Uncharacterized protein n=2 Tax=Candidatus Acidulodesulfobacterium TaxID=2597222 RepID=A0A519B9M0_9DELT|nr:MAG: hypothetical protein EVJ47_07065 [Candidatus Acidulodesulfobacterium ferriphilum]RZV39020.1 MAG: hypothetical protein EVJ48_05910 [Candidatus Acidulodesulfobacterium acidiphilum]